MNDWIDSCIEDCNAIATETIFNSTEELIKGSYQIGERILQDFRVSDREATYGQKLIPMIGKSLGKGKSSIYNMVAVARKEPDLDVLLSHYGKNVTWAKIVKDVVGKPEEVLPALPDNDKLLRIISDYLPWMINNLTQNKKGINLFLPLDKILYESEELK